MYCINCGASVDDNCIFCTNCGKRIKADPVVTVADQEAEVSATAETAPETTPETPAAPEVPAVASSAPAMPEVPVVAPTAPQAPAYSAEQPVMPFVPEKTEPEKVYFGKGALAFCLVIIGLLAISTGVFAGLYFSLV